MAGVKTSGESAVNSGKANVDCRARSVMPSPLPPRGIHVEVNAICWKAPGLLPGGRGATADEPVDDTSGSFSSLVYEASVTCSGPVACSGTPPTKLASNAEVG